MLQKYRTIMSALLRYETEAMSLDYFRDNILDEQSGAELKQLVLSVCGPYSIPEYAVLDSDTIPVIMYSDDQKGFMIQFEASTVPIFMYELDLWFESIVLSWEDVKDGTDEQLERIAKELVGHAVNSYFTGMKYEKYAEV